MPNPSVVTALARSFLAGEQSVDQIVARAAHTLGRDWRWLRAAAQRYVSATPQGTRPRLRDVVEFLRSDRALRRAGRGLQIAHWIAGPQLMQPAPVAADWPIPPIESAGDLAMWLQLTTSDLDWFADLRALGYKQTEPKLRHYHYRVLYKRSGAIRLIEAPKPRLKEMQRRILSQILEKIPAHPAVHGFLKNRSIRTFAAPHTGRSVVLRMDLRDFFPSFTGARIQTFFRMAGYPESVADLLGGICTNCAPRDAWAAAAHEVDRRELHDARLLYGRPHPAARRAHLARARQPVLLPHRLPSGRLGQGCRRRIHPLCRRSRLLRRRRLRAPGGALFRARCRSVARRRLRRSSPEDPRDAAWCPPASRRPGHEHAPQHPPRRLRSPEGDPDEL